MQSYNKILWWMHCCINKSQSLTGWRIIQLLVIIIISHAWPAGVVPPSICNSRRHCPMHHQQRFLNVSISTWQTQVCLGHPGGRFHFGLLSGWHPARMLTASSIAVRLGASSASRQTCPKTGMCHLWMWLMRSSCPVWLLTSAALVT